jgi:Actinobacteria/chloroflexi VLRF1 release factor
VKNIASSAGRWLDVAPSRFPGWVADFAERHGDDAGGAILAVAVTSENVIYTASDGAVAECHPPFPPVAGLAAAADPASCAEAIAAHAMAPRTVGVLLVRLGGYAAGVFTGSPPRLAASKTGSRLVHGRSAAGGWSQHRFARRREKQANEALQAAADAAATVFWRWEEGGKGLDAVVLGGDKRAVAELRADPRLLSYFEHATDRFVTVPDPKLAVLKDAPRLYLAVRIWLTEPAT